MKLRVRRILMSMAFLAVGMVPAMAQENDGDGWDFVYNGAALPQALVDAGLPGWQARSGETNGRPIYESILTEGAQVGGVWSRIDDNSPDPDFPSASNWARGYVFGTNAYNEWNGRMTLVMRIKDLGTDAEKSVVDITNSSGNYFTLGHATANAGGRAGWEFGQTDDGRNANGLSDVRTGGFNEWVVIRIVIIDDVPGDGQSLVRAWQDGRLVYESQRGDSISTGEFGEIAFRRTSGGNQQRMLIDWVLLEIGEAWAPGEGLLTPSGGAGSSINMADFTESADVNGAVGLDTTGVIRTVRGASISPLFNPFFAVDQNGIPTQFDIFYLGFDVYRDLETVSTDNNILYGLYALDKYSGVHSISFDVGGDIVSGPSVIANQVTGPQINYFQDVVNYNAANPDSRVFLPYFPFDLPIPTALDGAARDLEVAIDWRSATNAFQGYYILDAFAGIHYVNNAEILAMLNNNQQLADTGPYTVGMENFFNIFGFRPNYLLDYAGMDELGEFQTKLAPYFRFADNTGLPLARDLEVLAEFVTVNEESVQDAENRHQLAIDQGIDVSTLYQPIAMGADRLDPSTPRFAQSVAVTKGYAVLDGFGAVHTMVENEAGQPIPAPWENIQTGAMDPSANAPYFAPFDIAVDIELMPNNNGFVLLTRLGEVFVVNAPGRTAADNFVSPGIELSLPLFGFDAARDLQLVTNDEGKIVGMYVLDRFGTIHRAGNVPRIPGHILYFLTGNAKELELSPKQYPVPPASQ